MPQFADRVKVTSTSTGTGAITLSSTAVSGYQAFPSSLDGETVGYVIESGSAWEIGTGTYTHSSLNLTRSLRSSSTGSLLSLASGTHTVFLTPAYQDIQIVEAFSSTSDLPAASDNHGRVYHVHGEGALYFAHSGSWVKLANYSDITTYTHPNHSGEVTSTGDGATVIADDVVDEANLKVSNSPTDGYVLTARSGNTGGMTWEAASGGGIALTDLSVTQNSASGSGTLTYNNTSGVFSYTPPVISGGGGAIYSDPVRQTEYTGTATTTFNASSSPALSAYTVGNIQVFLNGSKLSASDFTATDGTSVVLGSACAASDVVTIVEYGAPFASQYSSTIFTVGTSSEYNTTTKVLTTDYTANRVAVYLNGVKLLVGTDCTATNGTTIDLTNAAPVTGDKIEVVEHGALADTVTTLTGLSDTPSSLGTAGQILQVNSGATALEFADASGSGVTTYANKTAIDAVSSPSEGDLAYDLAADQLYIRTTSAWKRISIGVDESPIITTEPATTHVLNSDGSTSTVTMVATDPEGFGITYGIAYPTANNALPDQLATATSINQSTGVFTFDPSTTLSDAGDVKVRLSASDGISTTTRLCTLSLSFTATADYLVIGGGGGGGSRHGGGGGAGGYIYSTGQTFNVGTTYSITVGTGGAGGSGASVNGSDGNDSSISGTGFTTVTAIGGGGGATVSAAGSGGSGGGGGYTATTGGSGTSGQGNAGGTGHSAPPYNAGGGGGAGAAGSNAGSIGGAGGAGLQNSITGTALYYAGGGGGGTYNTSGTSAGGSGVGGSGVGHNGTAGTPTANTGSGGGGTGGGTSGNGTTTAGADGVVIIRTTNTAASTTGSPTVTTDGSYNIYKFTASGTITF